MNARLQRILNRIKPKRPRHSANDQVDSDIGAIPFDYPSRMARAALDYEER